VAERSSWLEWKTVEVGGLPVAYGEAGAGTPVLFLHGWGLDHRSYKRALSRLVARDMHVLAPALPGFGGSAACDDIVTVEGFAAWLAAFLDAVGERSSLVVVGHSFGGAVGIAFAHQFGERVRALVLVNSIGASAWRRRGNVIRSMAERPLWDWGLHLPEDLWPLRQVRRVLPIIVSEAAPNLLRDPHAFFRVAAMARFADMTTELSELRERGLPIVVLWGRRDRIITRPAFEEMCELAASDTVAVEGGHVWLIVDPDRFAEIMTNVVDVAAEGTLEGLADGVA
jgi:pimeloyl-ACP methyl ester carboxylesterase